MITTEKFNTENTESSYQVKEDKLAQKENKIKKLQAFTCTHTRKQVCNIIRNRYLFTSNQTQYILGFFQEVKMQRNMIKKENEKEENIMNVLVKKGSM